MEWLSQQPADVRRRFALAAREIPGIRRPDALLALLLRYEGALPPAIHHELHREVAARARVLDTRVLGVIARSDLAVLAATANEHLGPADAEWLAVRCLASILPSASVADWDRNRAWRHAFQRLVARHRLTAAGLAGQVLFREACAPAGEQGWIAQQALSLYLAFGNVPSESIDRLSVMWRDHAWGLAQLRGHAPS
jgi:hypothetical protein